VEIHRQAARRREGERTVEFYLDGVIIKTWARQGQGRQTDWADFPPEKVAFFMSTPQWCLRRAGELGANVKALVEQLLDRNACYRLRQAQGVVGLADKHGAGRLDKACRRALQIGDPQLRTVRGILTAGTEDEGTESRRARRRPPTCTGRTGSSTTSRRWRDEDTSAGDDAPRAQDVGDARDFGGAPRPGGRRGARLCRVPAGIVRGRGRTPRRCRIARRVRAAHFEQICVLEDFDFSFNPKIPAARIRDLATLRFVDAGESVILHGPVGVGKTMIAQALGHHACRHGYNVTFTKASRLLADLAGGHADRTWETRLRRWGATGRPGHRRLCYEGLFTESVRRPV